MKWILHPVFRGTGRGVTIAQGSFWAAGHSEDSCRAGQNHRPRAKLQQVSNSGKLFKDKNLLCLIAAFSCTPDGKDMPASFSHAYFPMSQALANTNQPSPLRTEISLRLEDSPTGVLGKHSQQQWEVGGGEDPTSVTGDLCKVPRPQVSQTPPEAPIRSGSQATVFLSQVPMSFYPTTQPHKRPVAWVEGTVRT